MNKYINLPINKEDIKKLKAGDAVFLSGVIYSARDAAHKRMEETLKRNEKLPFNIENSCIYYLGPSPARENQIIGSAGPTTSGRMDKYTPELLDLGLKIMIGKGRRSIEVKKSMKQNGAIYLAAVGGAGALLSKCIVESEIIAYEDLGTEAIRKMVVKDFPAIVVIDIDGTDLYEKAIIEYKTI